MPPPDGTATSGAGVGDSGLAERDHAKGSQHPAVVSVLFVRLEVVPSILSSLLAAGAIHNLQASLLKSRPSHRRPPWSGRYGSGDKGGVFRYLRRATWHSKTRQAANERCSESIESTLWPASLTVCKAVPL